MKIEHWEISEELKKELDNHYKTAYSLSLKGTDPMDMARALTFDHLANTVTVSELDRLLTGLNTKFLKGGIKGVGLEVGSGPGTFVAAFANIPGVTKVYGAEACEAIIRELMVDVVEHIAPKNTDKIVGAIADFNKLSLPDNSVDFVFDFFSLHHSTNPTITMTEIARVLKPGGIIFCLDKARADRLSNADLEALLDSEYTEAAKRDMGLPPNVRHTRRMNGENEYRRSDWKRYFEASGFTNFTHYNVAKIGGSLPVRLLKKFVSVLPVNIQTKISPLFSKTITNNLEPSNRIFTDVFPSYRREFSLMIAWKK